MTQVRNYAAKAAKDIKKYYLTPFSKNIVGEEGFILLRYIHHMLGKAVHFVIPDGGTLFNDKLRGLRNQELHLPYPAITVETNLKMEGGEKIEVLTLAVETSQSLVDYCVKCGWKETKDAKISQAILFFAMYCLPKSRKHWLIMTISFRVAKNWDGGLEVKDALLKCDTHHVITYEIEAEAQRKGRTIEQQEENFALALVPMCRPIFELCEALSCMNVQTETVQKTSLRNAKRISQGKLPLFETKVLVINTNYKGSSGEQKREGGGGGSSTIRRQHLRRGHIRFLQSGRFKNKQGQKIWVNSTVVGNKNAGVINKQYEVR